MPVREPAFPDRRSPGKLRHAPKHLSRCHSIHKILAASLLLVVLAVACGTPTLPCGTFAFAGTPSGSHVDLTVTFNFNAATCGAAACNNRLEGYYYWLFVTDSSGNAGAPFDEIGVTWMQDSFNLAVTEWNTDAPGLGKHPFPAMSPLP